MSAARTGLRRVEAGLYSTPDGRWGVARVESEGEWGDLEGLGWSVIRGYVKDGEEVGPVFRTKALAAAALLEIRAQHERAAR